MDVLRLQTGASLDHCPFDLHTAVIVPTNLYPVLHVYTADDPKSVLENATLPFKGWGNVGHWIATSQYKYLNINYSTRQRECV